MSHFQRTRRSSRRRPRPQPQQRPLVEPHAAGIDVGARQMYVAIPPDRDQEPVRVFSTFTQDLEAWAGRFLRRREGGLAGGAGSEEPRRATVPDGGERAAP